jgi:hypothetical protein
MAKIKGEGGTRQNRIRLVVLDADLSEGNLSELTQAITQAIRQPSPIQRVTPALAPAQGANGNGHTLGPDVAGDDEPALDLDTEETPATSGSAKPANRKLPRQPEYLAGLFTSESAAEFRAFAAQHPTKKHAQRYLIAAMWLKDHGAQATINMDQVFTCYKTAGWPTNITDWDVNFRNHVGKTKRLRRVSPGEYAITPLGEDAVRTKAE